MDEAKQGGKRDDWVLADFGEAIKRRACLRRGRYKKTRCSVTLGEDTDSRFYFVFCLIG
jgi:hypothetical protein